jgi:predicted amidohydrolase
MKIACAQMTSSHSLGVNLHEIESILARAKAEKADLICLPENCTRLTKNQEELFKAAQTEDENEALSKLQELTQRYGMMVSIGSIALKDSKDKLVNRSYLLGPDGHIMGYYDKIHLFQARLPKGEIYDEAKYFTKGQHEVLIKTDIAKIGLSICFDLRFPDHYTTLAQGGAEIILIPSSFTYPTGKAHWEVLTRARAIETGAFVIASAQCGTNDDGIKTYGHSMIISPWGDVLAEAKDKPGIIYADLDFTEILKAQERLPHLKRHFP